MKENTPGLTAWFVLLCLSGVSAEEQARTFWLFDMGPKGSPLERDHVGIDEKSLFTDELGYGWVAPAEETFNRTDAPSIDSLRQDGVISVKDVAFKIALKPGKYHVRVLVGDPVIERKKMSVFVMEIPLATDVNTIPTWYRGEPTSYMLAGSVVLTANSMELRFLHEGTANSVHAIQIFREDARLFDPGLPASKLPSSLDLSFMRRALSAYRKKDFKQAMAEIDVITAKGSDYYKGYVLTWIAGRLDVADPDLKILKKATSYLDSASLRDPNHTAARMRLWQNQDFIKAVTYMNQAGYSHLFEKTGTGWGERRKTAQSLLRNVVPGDPLFYRAVMNLGRITYWVGQEADDTSSIALAKDYFRTVFKKYPGHPLVRMYLGEKLAWGQHYAENVPGAPKWAMRMREALGRLNDLIDFWISRQSDTGEFGGGWGDDVEMMRWWQPAAYATGSSKITDSMQKLADGIWKKSGIIRNGYFRGLAEVQYSSEPTADTQPNMLALRFGDPVYYERCLASGYLMKNIWTEINPKKRRLFKSVDIGAHKVGQDTRRAIDVPYHSRATIPAQWAACYSHNPDLIEVFEELAESWLEACARTDKGKPAAGFHLQASPSPPVSSVATKQPGTTPSWMLSTSPSPAASTCFLNNCSRSTNSLASANTSSPSKIALAFLTGQPRAIR